MRVLIARHLEEVVPVLAEVEAAARAGLQAHGFLSYEAAAALEPRAAVHTLTGFPFAWFVVGSAPSSPGPGADLVRVSPAAEAPEVSIPPLDFAPALSRQSYADAIAEIRRYLGRGNSYQVNYTFPLSADFPDATAGWFHQMCHAQGPGEYYALDTGTHQVLCASPELFFSLAGGRITMRPMKGTWSRGRWPEEDQARAQELRHSEKDRAENLMIVDMVRNDLGRIAEPGTVSVEELFSVERYETVWQMTSTVSAQTRAGLTEIFRALFPCASVTGAPKLETMRIIRELEPEPRGVYCGAVGWWGPGEQGRFSVGIRTAVHDKAARKLRYHVGSGITWDSTANEEYRECMQKAAVLTQRRPQFELLETLLWEEGNFFLCERHLSRLRESTDYFGFHHPEESIRDLLEKQRKTLLDVPRARVRLLLSRTGVARVEASPLDVVPAPSLRVALATAPVDNSDIFLYHKTTHRELYERHRREQPHADEVVLWNEHGQLTEGTFTNLVLEDAQGKWTPPREAGLLAGTFRQQLLDTGEIREKPLRREDLLRPGARLWLINSVRGWVQAALDASIAGRQ